MRRCAGRRDAPARHRSAVHLEVVSGLAARALGRNAKFLVIAGIAGNDPEVAHLQGQVSRVLGDR